MSPSTQVVFDPRDTWQLRPVVGALCHDHEPGTDVVAPVGSQPPPFDCFVPADRAYLGGQDRAVVQPEMLCDTAAMLVDLGTVGELLRRHEVELFQHRDVAVRVVVTLDSREAVPVPDTAEVPAHLDDVNVVDARLLEVSARQQPGDATAENRHLDVLGDRRARDHRCVRIDFRELREIVLEFQILRRSVCAQPFVAFVQVLLSQRVDVDVVRRRGRSACIEQRHWSGFS